MRSLRERSGKPSRSGWWWAARRPRAGGVLELFAGLVVDRARPRTEDEPAHEHDAGLASRARRRGASTTSTSSTTSGSTSTCGARRARGAKLLKQQPAWGGTGARGGRDGGRPGGAGRGRRHLALSAPALRARRDRPRPRARREPASTRKTPRTMSRADMCELSGGRIVQGSAAILRRRVDTEVTSRVNEGCAYTVGTEIPASSSAALIRARSARSTRPPPEDGCAPRRG